MLVSQKQLVSGIVNSIVSGFDFTNTTQIRDVSHTTPEDRQYIIESLRKQGNFQIDEIIVSWNEIQLAVSRIDNKPPQINNVIFVDFVNKKVIG